MTKRDRDKKLAASSTEKEGNTPGTELFWKFLGLQIDRKTEIIALSAFVLSISGVLLQIVNYTRGAVVRLFASDQIVITSTNKLGRNYTGEENLLAIIAPMSYVNEGNTGQNAIIRREYVRFSIGQHQVEHRWYEFGSSDVKDGNLVFDRKSEARPFPVNAGSAESHETLFIAWEIDCQHSAEECAPGRNFVKWDDLVKEIGTTRQLSLTTSADVYSKNPVSATCVVHLRDWEIKIIETVQWLSAACVEIDTGAPIQQKVIGPR